LFANKERIRMSMGSDLREAIIEDRVEEAIQKRIEAGEFYTAEQKRKEQIENDIEIVKKMMDDGIALDKSLQYIPEEYQGEVRKRIISE